MYLSNNRQNVYIGKKTNQLPHFHATADPYRGSEI